MTVIINLQKNNYYSIQKEMGKFMEFENVIAKLEEIYDVMYYSLGIAELGIAGVVLLYGIIAGLIATILGMLISLVVYVFQAIPLFKISKKMGRKAAWLVWLFWVPFIGGYFSTYVLADIPGDRPVKLLGNFMIKSRKMSFWIHLGIHLFAIKIQIKK